MLTKTVLFIFLLFPYFPLNAATRFDENLTIQLQQAIDRDCNGINDTAYSKILLVSILPTHCLMYKITAVNTSDKPHQHLLITGNIPAYTHLNNNSIFIDYHGGKSPYHRVKSSNPPQLKINIATLMPTEKVTVFYSVRID